MLHMLAGNKLNLLQYYHKQDFHVGSQVWLSTVCLKYWPHSDRNIALKIIYECAQCFKNRPIIANHLMKIFLQKELYLDLHF